ncbi:hypothetical protein CYMTET_3795 [Cymbomonas tetramitiformis]|uniref:Uncharacterized protein n=1 Tax=Cymbomonas tetramitiformis TaxID=36881 RepID=A0AAE0H4C6_9CHLO|nr:hypothetical protein CYMTET_3795 [Cymbomonas tetramitiformis]
MTLEVIVEGSTYRVQEANFSAPVTSTRCGLQGEKLLRMAAPVTTVRRSEMDGLPDWAVYGLGIPSLTDGCRPYSVAQRTQWTTLTQQGYAVILLLTTNGCTLKTKMEFAISASAMGILVHKDEPNPRSNEPPPFLSCSTHIPSQPSLPVMSISQVDGEALRAKHFSSARAAYDTYTIYADVHGGTAGELSLVSILPLLVLRVPAHPSGRCYSQLEAGRRVPARMSIRNNGLGVSVPLDGGAVVHEEDVDLKLSHPQDRWLSAWPPILIGICSAC